MRKSYFLFMIMVVKTANALIIETNRIEKVQYEFNKLNKDALVFLDIDDTVQTTKARMCAPHDGIKDSKAINFIDTFKAKRDQISDFDALITKWRLARKIQLVSPQWPSLITNCPVPIYALTQFDTGKSGDMERIEVWRYNELANLGINFTPAFNGKDDFVVMKDRTGIKSVAGIISPSVFYKGIFMTGAFSKGDIIRYVLGIQHPSKILFVDDRASHLQDVEAVCSEKGIPFVGILFRGVEKIKRRPLSSVLLRKIIALQKEMFLKGEWIEDEDAIKKFEG